MLSNKSRLARGLAVAGLVTAAALALSGCSGAGTSADTIKAGSDGLIPITVLRSAGSTFEPLYVAADQGYFKDAGLNVTIKAGAADTSANAPSVANGEAQFAMTDSAGFIKGFSQGIPIEAVAQLQASAADVPQSDGLFVKPGGSITSCKDLAGKTVAVPALGGIPQIMTYYCASAAGVDVKTIKFVAIPAAGLIDSLKAGQVDAISTFGPFFDAAKAGGYTLLNKGTNDILGLTQALLFSSTSFLKANEDTAVKFVAALTKGITYANAHPDDVRAIDKKYTTTDPKVIDARTIQKFSIEFNQAAMKTVIDTMFKSGIITTKPADNVSMFWVKAPSTK